VNVIVDELLVNYQLSGSGKLVVLLHGWGDNGAGLEVIQTSLSRTYQVLSLDLPGFGGTQPPKTVWDLDNYARFVAATLTKLKLADPYALIGHSNGGAIAIRGLSLGLLKPQKLILIAAAGIRTGASLKRLLLKIIAKTGNLATIWMPERYRRNLRESLYGVAGSDMLVAPELQETFKKSVRQDVQADAASITIPTLLIFGENDRAVPVRDGHTYKALIVGSVLEIVSDAGHFVHLDQTDKTNRLIQEFLK
jgi:pimeloyl-ACP methyl ester carboxylesterase